MRLLSVVGARPQFVKVAPICRALRLTPDAWGPVEHVIVHTGQHYDPAMSGLLFQQLQIPDPDVNLGVGSGSHAAQTAGMMTGLEATFLRVRPDVVIVYGDTNSTLAGCVVASKLHIPIAHVEAGLRSFDRSMPEEVNRVVSDHVSDLLLAPTPGAMENLAVEGLTDRAELTGDVMLDAVLQVREVAQHTPVLDDLALEPDGYGIVTLHRASNTEPVVLRRLLEGLNRVSSIAPLLFPLHPRTRAVLERDLPDWRPDPRLQIVDPLGYVEMLRVVDGARWVLTDSGGLQKEALFLGVPCVTLRRETEWNETVEGGANVLVGSDTEAVVAAVERWEADRTEGRPNFDRLVSESFGDGRAAHHILKAVTQMNPTDPVES